MHRAGIDSDSSVKRLMRQTDRTVERVCGFKYPVEMAVVDKKDLFGGIIRVWSLITKNQFILYVLCVSM